jgi:hypothetical protein
MNCKAAQYGADCFMADAISRTEISQALVLCLLGDF